MKRLSAVEVRYLVAELQQLVNARLQQVYQPSKKELILQFHLRGKGSVLLKVSVPAAAYIASGKGEVSAVTGFCSLLRKKLNSSVLTAISQPGFERILQLGFSSKKGSFGLIFELFSKGNIILTHNSKIAAVQEKQLWSTRELKMGADYKLPPTARDPAAIDEKQLLQLLNSTAKTDLVRFLALEFSLGGLYAEELCILANVDKKKSPATVTAAEAKKLLQSLKKLLNSAPSPSVIYENSKPVDALPVSLNLYVGHEKRVYGSFSEALEAFAASTAEIVSSYDAEISRLKAVIQQQQETIAAYKNSAEKTRRSGELIYEHYQEVKGLLEAVNSARKQGGWEAVRQLRKTNRKITSVDDKTGKFAVDL